MGEYMWILNGKKEEEWEWIIQGTFGIIDESEYYIEKSESNWSENWSFEWSGVFDRRME